MLALHWTGWNKNWSHAPDNSISIMKLLLVGVSSSQHSPLFFPGEKISDKPDGGQRLSQH